jgi:hypothetical protein
MAREGYTLRPLGPRPERSHEEGVFADRLRQVLDAQVDVPELAGVVVVLAPGVLERPAAFAQSIARLVRAREGSRPFASSSSR